MSVLEEKNKNAPDETTPESEESKTPSVEEPKEAQEETSSEVQEEEVSESSQELPAADGSKKGLRTRPIRGLPFFRGRFARDKKSKKVRRRRVKKKRPKKDRKPPSNFKQELLTVPNILTYLRIAMLPLILVIVNQDSRQFSFWAALIFAVAAFTDLFDGYFARKLNQVTILGKLLDPLADKLIVSGILIILVPMGRVASWIVIILLAREFAITGLRGIAASEGMVIAASPLAKFKTIYQMLALFCLLIHFPYRIDYFGMFELLLNFHRIGMFFLYLALGLSLASGFEYFWKFGVAINSKYASSAKSASAS